MADKGKYHQGNLREKLIAAAIDIIAEEGLEKVSMRILGSKLGVSRSAPYKHFAGKSALLCAIAEEGCRGLIEAMSSANQQLSDDPLTRLKNTGIAYVTFALANPVHYRIMFGNEILETERTPELTKTAEASFNELLKAVKICQTEGLLKPLDTYVIANTLWVFTHGLSTLLIDGQIQAINALTGPPTLLQHTTDTGTIDIPRIFDAMGEIVFTGLLAET